MFSPDGTRILTASADKTAKLWDAASVQLTASFQHKDAVHDAAFSPDGARILTASADKTAKLWDTASGKQIASFEHQDAVRGAAFSPDGDADPDGQCGRDRQALGCAPRANKSPPLSIRMQSTTPRLVRTVCGS